MCKDDRFWWIYIDGLWDYSIKNKEPQEELVDVGWLEKI
jgi:hypothetical protein